MSKKIIWSELNLDVEDWKEDYKEIAELNGWDEDTNYMNEADIYDYMYRTNADYLDDERENLNIQLAGRILVIADLGLWNGRRQGYRIIKSGNIADILYNSCDGDMEFYCDQYNMKATECHHDGINHYEFREIREDRNIENLLNDLYYGKNVSRKKLNYYTKSIRKPIAEVYGW